MRRRQESRHPVPGLSAALAATILACATGCAPARARVESIPERAVEIPTSLANPPASAPDVQAPSSQNDEPEGVFHIVQPGQTLWRIAHAYGVPLDALVAANRIEDPAAIEEGTFLFVPGADRTLDFAPFPAPVPGPRAPRRDAANGARQGEFLWPVPGGEILGSFGERRRTHRHSGIDIRGRRSDEILAAAPGRVAFAGPSGSGYGKMIVLDHGDGLRTLYAHASAILVSVGDEIETGTAIARVGRSGNATTEHCHFEVLVDERPVDPMPYLEGPATVAK